MLNPWQVLIDGQPFPMNILDRRDREWVIPLPSGLFYYNIGKRIQQADA
jgi:hypothetical protein